MHSPGTAPRQRPRRDDRSVGLEERHRLHQRSQRVGSRSDTPVFLLLVKLNNRWRLHFRTGSGFVPCSDAWRGAQVQEESQLQVRGGLRQRGGTVSDGNHASPLLSSPGALAPRASPLTHPSRLSATSRSASEPPCLDSSPDLPVGSFCVAKHWCCAAWKSSVETALARQVVASREIRPGEELTVGYGNEYWKHHQNRYASSDPTKSFERAYEL